MLKCELDEYIGYSILKDKVLITSGKTSDYNKKRQFNPVMVVYYI